jgi:hypothetical protein
VRGLQAVETGCSALFGGDISRTGLRLMGLFDMTGVMGGAVALVDEAKEYSTHENGTLQSFRHLERAVRRVSAERGLQAMEACCSALFGGDISRAGLGTGLVRFDGGYGRGGCMGG